MRSRRALRPLVAGAIALALVALAPSRAPANIQEQRARLPPPAGGCTDPVEGVWMSHAYYPHVQQWYIVKLEIHRVAGTNRLYGSINAHHWGGGPADARPPECRPGIYRRVMSAVTADGTIVGRDLRFRGLQLGPETLICGWSALGRYELDEYHGVLAPEGNEFQSILNAGPYWVNVPTVFRRIRCLEGGARPGGGGAALGGPPASQPHVEVHPPPVLPPHRAGCSAPW